MFRFVDFITAVIVPTDRAGVVYLLSHLMDARCIHSSILLFFYFEHSKDSNHTEMETELVTHPPLSTPHSGDTKPMLSPVSCS